MGAMECKTSWVAGNRFESKIRQHTVVTDTRPESGGTDQGPSPKELLLASICGCAGIDVASILSKMRVDLQSCDVFAQTETTAGYPSIFTEVRLRFEVTGNNIKPDQALKAVSLSMTKYCGVSAMVAEASPMTYEVLLNGESIGSGKAQFEYTSA